MWGALQSGLQAGSSGDGKNGDKTRVGMQSFHGGLPRTFVFAVETEGLFLEN